MKPKRTSFRARLDEMVKLLREAIITNQYQPGDFLPSETNLIERFQLSKNSVRKGLDILLQQGLIEKVPSIGTKVTGPKPESIIRIRFGYHPTMLAETNLLALIDRFHQKYPNVFIQPIPSNSYLLTQPLISRQEYLSSIEEEMERDNFDVFCLNNHSYDLFSNNNMVSEKLEPLEPAAGVFPFLTRPFTVDELLYLQPFVFSPIVLCFNKEHFREVGLEEPDSSWTWDNVLQAASKLNLQGDRIGIYFNLLSINRWPIFLMQNQVSFSRDAANKLIPNDSNKFREALDTAKNLFSNSDSPAFWSSESDHDSAMLFAEQKVSMIVTSYFNLNRIKNVDFAYDITPLPYLHEAKTHLSIIGLGILKSSKHKQASKTFLDFLMSEEIQLEIRKQTMSLPSLRKAAEWRGEESITRPPGFFMFRDIIPTYRFYSDMNITYQELVAMRYRIKQYWSRLEDFESVCRKIGDIPPPN